MSSIPLTRSVIGRDLDEIKQLFGISTSEAVFLFGLSITKWTQIVRNKPDEPLKDPALALLVRFLSKHPELSVIPKPPTATEMYEQIGRIFPLNAKEFSVFLGSEGSAYNRWKKSTSRQGPSVQRLLYYMRLALLGRPHADQLTLLNDWKSTVTAEGSTRGVPDVFNVGQWMPREEIEKSKLSIGAKAGAAKSKLAKQKKMGLRKPSTKV